MARKGRVEGKIALVTGGGAGIGQACCRHLADEGAVVAVLDVDAVSGQAVASSLVPTTDAMFIACDVTDPDAMVHAIATIVERFGRLDIAVNNAGIGGVVSPIPEYPTQTWDRVIATNLTGVFYGLRAQIPVLAAQGGGAIVNVASLMGTVGYPGISAYVAAKHGVAGLTKVAALEWGEHGVRVNAVAPSFIKTKLTTAALPAEAWDVFPGMHALRRCAEPAEIAALVTFLCSDEASYITGSLHLVDGGYTAI
jgi:NAD(P)-dependent dehydrogenase (short-subunit alcohol dehydrogenase family)